MGNLLIRLWHTVLVTDDRKQDVYGKIPNWPEFDRNRLKVIQCLEQTTPAFLTHLIECGTISQSEKEIIEDSITSMAKLQATFNIIRHKDNGWSSLLKYLCNNNYKSLAESLYWGNSKSRQNFVMLKNAIIAVPGTIFRSIWRPLYARATRVEVTPVPTKDRIIEVLNKELVDYWPRSSLVKTMFDTHLSLADVWIPIKFQDSADTTSVDYTQLLKRFEAKECNTIVVRGNPGTGKSTFLKKVKADFVAGKLRKQFDQVLHIELGDTDIGSFDNILLCTVQYHAKLFAINDEKRLLKAAGKLKDRLLICLDEADQKLYSGQLGQIFAQRFSGDTTHRISKSLNFKFKLLITTRPYAGSCINTKFQLSTYDICTLTIDDMLELARRYCPDKKTFEAAQEFIKNASFDLGVPLIVTFVCFLASCNVQLPGTRTKLYERCMYHMLEKEAGLNKLVNKIELKVFWELFEWLQTNVVLKTSELAYAGIVGSETSFPSDMLDTVGVTEDSYICGYLLYRDYIFRGESDAKAKFLHQSVQEFFAALYFFQQLLEKKPVDIEWLLTDYLYYNRTVSDFFFGLCFGSRNDDKVDAAIQTMLPQPKATRNICGGVDKSDADQFCLTSVIQESLRLLVDVGNKATPLYVGKVLRDLEEDFWTMSKKFFELHVIKAGGDYCILVPTSKDNHVGVAIIRGVPTADSFVHVDSISTLVLERNSTDGYHVKHLPECIPPTKIVILPSPMEVHFTVHYDFRLNSAAYSTENMLRIVRVELNKEDVTRWRSSFDQQKKWMNDFTLQSSLVTVRDRGNHLVVSVQLKSKMQRRDLIRGLFEYAVIAYDRLLQK